MFEEVLFILGFMVFSVIISYLLIRYTSGLFLTIIKILAAIGIVIHEIFHLIMCYITRVKVVNISILKKLEVEKAGALGYYGQVNIHEEKVSFIQAILVSFAPLYFSFWLFFSILEYLVNNYNQVHPLVFFLSILLMISLILSASPSFSDLALIPKAFSNNSDHSLYQIFLIVLASLMAWVILIIFQIPLDYKIIIHQIIFYFIVTGFYFIFKLGFKLIFNIYNRRTNRIKSKNYVFRRYKAWKRTR